ncbi:MAG: site-specific integrase, partial [bacterium]|nr:site-specific integrase [bacterium]
MPDYADSAVIVDGNLLPVEPREPLKALVDDFLQDLDAARKSPHTIKNYRSDLGRFNRFLVEKGSPVDIPLIRDY